jgi:hypothetical protein
MVAAVAGGHVAITQAEHATMCARIADAWGGERFGEPAPRDVLRRAAEEHELGWEELDAAPALHAPTGLPAQVMQLPFSRYIDGQVDGPRRLAARDPHAALIASLKHGELYRRPGRLGGLLRADGRRLRRFFAASAALQRELRAQLDVDDADVERGWRVVRAWDGLSHDLILDRAPCERRDVPDAAGALVTLRLARAGDAAVTVDPWPFAADGEVVIPVRGRLLESTYADEAQLHAALAAAPAVTLTYRLTAV